MFERVERDDANRSIELPSEQIGDDGLKVRPLDLRFAVHGTRSSEAVHHEVDGLISAIGTIPVTSSSCIPRVSMVDQHTDWLCVPIEVGPNVGALPQAVQAERS
jgi:hypothetical protein